MIALLFSLALAAEPAWVQTFTVPAPAGPPDDTCVAVSDAASPGVKKEPTPKPEPQAGPETEGMVRWDTAPGAANPQVPEPVRKRLGVGAPFDVATIALEPLRGHPDDLRRVLAVMQKAARRDSVTRLAFWGASHVAGEYWTGELRRLLQDRYGDAGHGFVMPAAPWKGYRASDVNLCSQGRWVSDWHNRSGGRGDGRWGPAGFAVESSDPTSRGWVQTTRTNPQGRALSRFELLYLRQPGGGAVDLSVDGGAPLRVPTAADALGPGVAVLQLPDGPHRVELSPAGDGPVRLFGATMEREGPGVVLDAMGVTGRTASSWLAWDEALMGAYLARRTPDLVVLAYGTNEANDRTLSDATYREQLRGVLGKMRRMLPDAACVLVGPSDRGRKIKGTTHVIWGRTAPVALAQREIGPEFGCVTWDLQEATGGPGSMFRWREAGLAAPDLIHFSPDGYKELARRFLAALDQP